MIADLLHRNIRTMQAIASLNHLIDTSGWSSLDVEEALHHPGRTWPATKKPRP